jgi:hypothetical protein
LALKIACPLKTTGVVVLGAAGVAAILAEGAVAAGGKVGEAEAFDELLKTAAE